MERIIIRNALLDRERSTNIDSLKIQRTVDKSTAHQERKKHNHSKRQQREDDNSDQQHPEEVHKSKHKKSKKKHKKRDRRRSDDTDRPINSADELKPKKKKHNKHDRNNGHNNLKESDHQQVMNCFNMSKKRQNSNNDDYCYDDSSNFLALKIPRMHQTPDSDDDTAVVTSTKKTPKPRKTTKKNIETDLYSTIEQASFYSPEILNVPARKPPTKRKTAANRGGSSGGGGRDDVAFPIIDPLTAISSYLAMFSKTFLNKLYEKNPKLYDALNQRNPKEMMKIAALNIDNYSNIALMEWSEQVMIQLCTPKQRINFNDLTWRVVFDLITENQWSINVLAVMKNCYAVANNNLAVIIAKNRRYKERQFPNLVKPTEPFISQIIPINYDFILAYTTNCHIEIQNMSIGDSTSGLNRLLKPTVKKPK